MEKEQYDEVGKVLLTKLQKQKGGLKKLEEGSQAKSEASALNSDSNNIKYVDFKAGQVLSSAKTPSANSADPLANLNVNSIEHLNFHDLENSTILDNVKAIKPSVPVYFTRPHSIKKFAQFFLKNFKLVGNLNSKRHQGSVLYSVKSNPDVATLRHLYDAGVRDFDVASLVEVKLIQNLFGKAVKMYFMHPIKSREAIHEAYFNYGIRDFSLDSFDELTKILTVTNNAKDLGLHVRLAIPNSKAAIDLSGKFGIRPTESIGLIRKVRAVAKRFGICFHVGSQCMDPTQYRSALNIASEVIEQAQVKIDVLDIGGGFPSVYPGFTPPKLQDYFSEINDAITALELDKKCQIWCEPGRALVAESGSLLVRVESRKENMLYINDGTYGGLFDAGYPGFIFPTQAIRLTGEELSEDLIPFGFYGPTCDSLDTMKGPFYLPDNIQEGDYIEIGQLGAYSKSIRTEFNGFNKILQIEVSDAPISSIFHEDEFLEEQIIDKKS